jgi:hypothetical protein
VTPNAAFRISPPSASAPEWEILQTRRPNVLLTAPREVVDAALARLWPLLEAPVYEWSSRAGIFGPGRSITVLIRDVETLTCEQQHTVLAWLDSTKPQEIQIVSTAHVEVFPLVERGVFLSRLYYRLNVLQLDACTLIREAV